MSYRNLETWQLAREVSLDIHDKSLKLPKFEQFEEGHQVRRSSKSIRANIVEGYGRRLYPGDLTRFIVIALASNDETIDHLETLYESKPLRDEQLYLNINANLKSLGIKLSRFLRSLETTHTKPHFYASTPAKRIIESQNQRNRRFQDPRIVLITPSERALESLTSTRSLLLPCASSPSAE